ncbi:MAG: 50S ribosomal protein L29 [Anaerolineae bacterium]|nr:50S ribosomal protein L29 [Anaerolineae bacterium]
MRAKEIRQMDSSELANLLETKREELFKLRLNWAAGSLEDPNQMTVLRKDIARMLTVLHERELARQIVGEEGSNA